MPTRKPYPETRTPKHGLTPDHGGALMGVIAIMAVTMVVAMAGAGASMNALSFTSSTRAAVQAQAAADTGVDVATANIASGACAASVSRVNVPAFTATTQYSMSGTGVTWNNGCPVPGAQRVRIVSTGKGAATGVAGNASGNTRTVEAIYELPEPTMGIEVSGAAIYGSVGAVFGANFGLDTGETGARIEAHSGNVTCEGNNWINADVLVSAGSLEMDSNCKIRGDVWSRDKVTLLGNSYLDGDLWSQADVEVGGNGVVTGTVTAKRIRTKDNGVIATSAPMTGTPLPAVPEWVDFAYRAGDWVDPANRPFAVATMGGFNCQLDAPDLLLSPAPAKPLILDASTCVSVKISGNTTLALTADVVVVAKKFEFEGNTSILAETEQNLWFVTPDTTGPGPTCADGGRFSVDGNFIIHPKVAAFIYTPCPLTIGANTVWRGQIYAANPSIGDNTRFTYIPMGLPGVDLDDGTTGGTIAAPLGGLLSLRDLTS